MTFKVEDFDNLPEYVPIRERTAETSDIETVISIPTTSNTTTDLSNPTLNPEILTRRTELARQIILNPVNLSVSETFQYLSLLTDHTDGLNLLNNLLVRIQQQPSHSELLSTMQQQLSNNSSLLQAVDNYRQRTLFQSFLDRIYPSRRTCFFLGAASLGLVTSYYSIRTGNSITTESLEYLPLEVSTPTSHLITYPQPEQTVEHDSSSLTTPAVTTPFLLGGILGGFITQVLPHITHRIRTIL